MVKVPEANPFLYGTLVGSEAFADREDELAELETDARDGQDVVVFAPRRYGKSSLVARVAEHLVSQGAVVAQVDLMTTPTKERLASKLAETIFEDVATVLERAREKALAPLRALRLQPTVTVDPADGSFRFQFAVTHDPQDIDATLERLFELPGELGASQKRDVVLVLDEFQEIVSIDPLLPRLMRSIFQSQPRVCHLYLGSKRHVIQRIFNDANEPFYRSAKSIELQRIDVDAFTPFIATGFAGTGRSITEDAIARLLQVTGGHPHATQELAHFLWEHTAPRGTASADDLGAALRALLNAEHAHFTLQWNELSSAQKLVVEALAEEQPARPLTAPYRTRHGLGTSSGVQRALGALEAKELVARDGSEWRLFEPFLAEWVRANVSGTA
jgi:hypothetical protein